MGETNIKFIQRSKLKTKICKFSHKYYNLYNKTTYVFVYVAYSRPNGWADWAEIVSGHSGMAEECYKIFAIFKTIF